MPTCGNCRQEAEFYEHDGLFYCNECDTQSQVMCVIENEFETILDYTHSYTVSKKHRNMKEDKVNEESADGKSWWSCELYQAILKSQIKALVAMGFPAKLDEVVMQLWFHYLRNCGAAFCKTGKVSSSAKRRLEDSDEEDRDEKGEDLENETSPSKSETQDGKKAKVRSIDDFLHRNSKGDVVTVQSRKSVRRRIRLGLWDSVCLMYIGLRLVDEPVLLSDMIRWVRQGHLPLRATSEVLPEHINKSLSSVDINRFCNPSLVSPDLNFVFDLCCLLTKKLKISLPPSGQHEMSLTIARMVVTLNLPVELCKYTHQLYLKVQPALEDSKMKVKPLALECQALAYIIVALKLLFVLNDDMEHRFSSYTRRLQTLFSEETVRLFNWGHWVEAQKFRGQHVLGPERSVLNLSDYKKVSDLPAFVQHFNNFYQVEQVNKHLHLATNSTLKSQERLTEYRRSFRSLSKKSSPAPDLEPSSFVMTRPQPDPNDREGQADISLEESSNVQRTSFGKEWLSRDYLLHEDFSKHTLKHLTDMKELCEQSDVSPESVRMVVDLSDQAEDEHNKSKKLKKSKRSKEESSSAELSLTNSKQSAACSDSQTRSGSRKRSKNCKKKPSHKKDKSGERCPPRDRDARESSSGEAVDEDDTLARSQKLPAGIRLDSLTVPYEIYPSISKLATLNKVKFEHRMDTYHTSMEWLLDHCIKIWEMRQTNAVACSVHNVEKVLFKL